MKITKNFVKKIVLILMSSLLVLGSSFLVPAIAMAEEAPSTWYNQGFTDWYAKVYGDDSPHLKSLEKDILQHKLNRFNIQNG